MDEEEKKSNRVNIVLPGPKTFWFDCKDHNKKKLPHVSLFQDGFFFDSTNEFRESNACLQIVSELADCKISPELQTFLMEGINTVDVVIEDLTQFEHKCFTAKHLNNAPRKITKFRLRECFTLDNRDQREILTRAAAEGDVEAEFLYGRCCFYGRGVQQSFMFAKQHFELARNYGPALAYLARINFLGLVGHCDDDAARKLVKLSAMAPVPGFAALQFLIGYWRTSKDERILYSEILVANRGTGEDFNDLGCFYLVYGKNKERHMKAMASFLTARTLDVPVASLNIAFMLDRKLVEPCFYGRLSIAELYLEAAKKGNELATGVCYERGYGEFKVDFKKAFDLYEKIKDSGTQFFEVYARLANCYHNGIGVAKNIEQARKWYMKAKEYGDWDADAILLNIRFQQTSVTVSIFSNGVLFENTTNHKHKFIKKTPEQMTMILKCLGQNDIQTCLALDLRDFRVAHTIAEDRETNFVDLTSVFYSDALLNYPLLNYRTRSGGDRKVANGSPPLHAACRSVIKRNPEIWNLLACDSRVTLFDVDINGKYAWEVCQDSELAACLYKLATLQAERTPDLLAIHKDKLRKQSGPVSRILMERCRPRSCPQNCEIIAINYLRELVNVK
jgi:TPR repeat protein